MITYLLIRHDDFKLRVFAIVLAVEILISILCFVLLFNIINIKEQFGLSLVMGLFIIYTMHESMMFANHITSDLCDELE